MTSSLPADHSPDAGPDAAALADPARSASAAGSLSARRRAAAFGLLWVALPFAALVLWAMAVSSASATGGCGGG